MSVEAVHEVLASDPPVSALVGDRIYPMSLEANLPVHPNPKLPAITLQEVSAISVSSQDGESGLVRPRVTVNCWAPTRAEAEALAKVVRARLGGFRNSGAGGTIQGTFQANRRDLYDGELKLFGRSVDYLVWNEEE